jgi:hypothetical protein
LTALRGAWRGSGAIAYRYQWYRCDGQAARCSSIHGATAPSYRVVAADVAHTVALTVNAVDSSGTASAYASVVGPVAPASATFVSTVQPAVTGKVVQGGSLQVDNGAWSKTPTSYSYSWLRCNANGRICAPIAGAATATYAITAGDAGHVVVAAVTASTGAAGVVALSTAPSTGSTPASPGKGPVNTGDPSVTGSALQGNRLTAAPGAWTGAGTISYAYQWYRCDAAGAHCGSLHGATAGTHLLVAADVSHTMGLTVKATDSAGATSAYASLVGPVAAAGASLIAAAQPAITGAAVSGKTLTSTTGTWSPAPAAFTFAWQRCNPNGRICVPIVSANAATYVVAAADQGHRLLAIVGATAGTSTAKTFSRSVAVP